MNWIKVEDSLPERLVPVLVWSSRGGHERASMAMRCESPYSKTPYWWFFAGERAGCCDSEPSQVTHWSVFAGPNGEEPKA